MAAKRLTHSVPWIYQKWDMTARMHRTMDPRIASVYVMSIEAACCKIGYAADVEQRRRELQTGCPDRVDVSGAIRLLLIQTKKIESEVHKDLKKDGRHMRGEWFRIHPALAVDIVRRVAAAYGYDFVIDRKYGFGG